MLYFMIYLFLEILVSVNIASAIGALATFLEVVATAFLGVIILMRFQSVLSESMRSVSTGQIDLKTFQERGIFTLFGAIFLIVPGFMTDILGGLLQFHVVTSLLVNRFAAQFDAKTPHKPTSNQTKDDNVIDVEIISDADTRN